VRSTEVPVLGYGPNCGGVGCMSGWVFITPWCGMGFCSMAGGGCCTYGCGACGGVGGAEGCGPFTESFIHLKSTIWGQW
jgi:hypothetical protein